MTQVPHDRRNSEADDSERKPPLFVDLDGTLIKSDLLIESFFVLALKDPRCLLLMPFWLAGGKAHLKQKIAERVDLAAGLLPFNPAFLDFLRDEAGRGRTLILATASDQRLARQVADHLGIFQDVLASDGRSNMAGARKLQAILDATGQGRFDYAGNAAVDLKIWPHAREAILVGPDSGVEDAARRLAQVGQVFDQRKRGPLPYLKAMRVHQWLKNLLVFVPLLMAHAWGNATAIVHSLLAFLAFGLCASSVYLLNDLLDLPSDRAHPRKRRRPFAAGDVPLLHGLWMMPALLVAGLAVAATLPKMFIVSLMAYLAITLAYSLYLKSYVLIDVMILAGLYTLRVICGAFAINTVPTFWLLAFSMCIFLSLALVKRCSELISLAKIDRLRASGRDYNASDLAYLSSMGTASGYLSVLVLALFINSPEVATRYAHLEVLWLLCPLVLYWMSRLWIKTGRGEMEDDPIVFTLKDRGSRFVIAVSIAVVVAATGALF
jgi:4-hydroxybenzoate polyprenyltransferase/phosphoserine phosphatase